MTFSEAGRTTPVIILRSPQLSLWFLWCGAVILLSVMPNLSDGVRENIPYGQYIFFMLTLSVLAILITSIPQKRLFVRCYYHYLFLLMVMFLAIIPSAVNAPSPIYSLRLLAIIFITTLPFIILGVGAKNKKILIPLFAVSVICAFGTLFLQWYGPVNFGAVGFINHLHGLRWSFLFNEANDLGWICVVGIVTGMYFLLMARSRLGRSLLLFILLPILLFVFYMTNSRASFLWLGWALLLFFAVILYLGYEYYKKPSCFWIIVGFSIVVAGGVFYFILGDRLYSFLRLHQNDVTSGRFPIWLVYWEQLKAHPWFGIGFGATAEFLKGELVETPLNVVVGLFGETGVVGAVPFFLLWISGAVIAVRVLFGEWHLNKNRSFLALWILMMLGGIALQQMGEWSLMRVSPLHYLFFFVLSLAWRLRHDHAKERASHAAIST